MLLYKVKINNFRNYNNVKVNVDGIKTVFLIGENGQGKTNFLEVLYYLSYASSFRTKQDINLIQHDQTSFYIQAQFKDKNEIKQNISIFYEKKTRKKTIKINGKKITDRKDILHVFPSLIFKHSDINFVTGTAEFQRQLIDQTLVMAHTPYLIILREYKKIIRQKTQALKQKQNNLIPTYNRVLAEKGLEIMKYRKKAILFFSQKIQTLFPQIFDLEQTSPQTKTQAYIKYNANWKISQKEEQKNEGEKINATQIYNILDSYKEQEKNIGFCISGPHRDKILFYLFNHQFKEVASTGQIRLFSILLRVLQAEYYHLHTNTSMIYLFDDVFLEIDIKKRMKFLQLLPEARQMFFTFLPSETLPQKMSQSQKKYMVKQGVILDI